MYYRVCRGDNVDIPLDLGDAFDRAVEVEELIQNNALNAAILAGVEELTERDVAALRGLWRGRSKAQKEKQEQEARMRY